MVVSNFIKIDYTYKPYSTINFTGPWDPKIVSSDSLFRIFYLVHLVAQLEEDTQVRGIVVIMDFDGLSMKQVYKSVFFSDNLTYITNWQIILFLILTQITNKTFIKID